MKSTRVCPKCGGSDIVIVDGWAGAHGSGNNVILGSTIFSAVGVNRYICCTCGFTEEWIDREHLQKIKASRKAHR